MTECPYCDRYMLEWGLWYECLMCGVRWADKERIYQVWIDVIGNGGPDCWKWADDGVLIVKGEIGI